VFFANRLITLTGKQMKQSCEIEAALVDQFSGRPLFLKSFGAMQVGVDNHYLHGIQMEYFDHTAFKVPLRTTDVFLLFCLDHSAFRTDPLGWSVLSKRWQDVYKDISPNQIRGYMRALLTSLQTMHAASVVHRDIKPGNFLFNLKSSQARLVDFGMARSQDAASLPSKQVWHANMSNSHDMLIPIYQVVSSNWRKRHHVLLAQCAVISVRWQPNALGPRVSEHQKFYWEVNHTIGTSRPCTSSSILSGPAYYQQKAWTCWYRHPSIDIWSAGVILLSFLTQRETIFTHPNGDKLDDALALEQMAIVFGSEAIQSLGHILSTTYFQHLIFRLQPDVFVCSSVASADRDIVFAFGPYEAIGVARIVQRLQRGRWCEDVLHLLEQLLTVDPRERPTATTALRHPFFIQGD
jgi:serine/threonine protein kinase